MWTYILGPLLAFLPERWRAALVGEAPVNWPRAALLSGLLQLALCLGLLVGWYFLTIQRLTAAQYDATMEATKGVPGYGAGMVVGFAALISFWLHPLTWVLAYFTIEGLLRTLAAALTEEAAGTLPLILAERAATALERRSYESRVPRVADIVTPGDGQKGWDLMVSSCRPKPAWRYPATIEFEGAFFQVLRENPASATPSRPHVYLLRRPPPGEAFRGVMKYSPHEPLAAEEKPRFFLVELRDRKRAERQIRALPLVPDVVTTAEGDEGWHLSIVSCRPKPDWTPGRTIRYEGVLYAVAGTFEAPPPRPFGFRLRRQLPTEAARGRLDYSPDEPVYKYGK